MVVATGFRASRRFFPSRRGHRVVFVFRLFLSTDTFSWMLIHSLKPPTSIAPSLVKRLDRPEVRIVVIVVLVRSEAAHVRLTHHSLYHLATHHSPVNPSSSSFTPTQPPSRRHKVASTHRNVDVALSSKRSTNIFQQHCLL